MKLVIALLMNLIINHARHKVMIYLCPKEDDEYDHMSDDGEESCRNNTTDSHCCSYKVKIGNAIVEVF